MCFPICPLPTNITHVDQYQFTEHGINPWNINYVHFDSKRFPFSNFKHSLTLFSKFFSSFPHGTCSLSVSCQYLALDGTYHPLRAAVPSNSTRRTSAVHSGLRGTDGIITLYDLSSQTNYPRAAAGDLVYTLQLSYLETK